VCLLSREIWRDGDKRVQVWIQLIDSLQGGFRDLHRRELAATIEGE